MRALIALWVCGCLTTVSMAQSPPTFRWGADKTGGAPYLYDDSNGKLIGFEVEFAEYLASELGRKSEFVQGEWSLLPELLGKGNTLDVVMNGYEFDPKLEASYPSTIPYYVYSLALVVDKDDPTINSWEDLRRREGQPKKRVGVLTGSAAQRYLEAEFADDVEIVPNGDVANVYDLVHRGRQVDATVQDHVSARHFLNHDYRGKLRQVGEYRAPGYYVILTRSEDAELRDAINAAIRKGLKSGKLREIYAKYDLWTPEQETLADVHAKAWPPDTKAAPTNWGLILRKLVTAAGMTVLLTCLSMPLAILIGLMVAIGRMYGPRILRVVLGIYVEVIRGTPLLLQLYFLFYLMPRMVEDWFGISLDFAPIYFGILGLGINYSAYEAENYRAGLLAVPRGQMEAALALGMTQTQALRNIIVPQAVRIVIPPVTNDFIALFKDTSVCSIIMVAELTRQYNELFNGNRDIIIELAAITAGLYLLMSYPLSLLASRLEHQSPTTKA